MALLLVTLFMICCCLCMWWAWRKRTEDQREENAALWLRSQSQKQLGAPEYAPNVMEEANGEAAAVGVPGNSAGTLARRLTQHKETGIHLLTEQI